MLMGPRLPAGLLSMLPTCSSLIHSYFQLVQMPHKSHFMVKGNLVIQPNLVKEWHKDGLLFLVCFYRLRTVTCPFWAFSVVIPLYIISP